MILTIIIIEALDTPFTFAVRVMNWTITDNLFSSVSLVPESAVGVEGERILGGGAYHVCHC